MNSTEQRYRVHGSVTDVNGREVSGAAVRVALQRLRASVELGTGRADEEGVYHINYRPPDDVPGRLFIIVEARSERLHDPIRSAPTEIRPDLQIDLQATPRDTSEFSTLLRAVDPLLDGMKLEDLVESDHHHDLTYLAQETSKTAEQMMQLVVAERLHQGYGTATAAFYAFLRQHIPSSLPPSLLEASENFTLIDSLIQHVASLVFGLSPGVQTSTLQAAIAVDLISQDFSARIPAIVAELQSHRQTDALTQPYLVGKTTLGQLLDLAQLALSQQQAFAKALQDNTQPMDKFWETLGDGQHGFTPQEVAAVQQTLELGAFVKNQVPLLTTLKQGFASGTYKSLTGLALMGHAIVPLRSPDGKGGRRACTLASKRTCHGRQLARPQTPLRFVSFRLHILGGRPSAQVSRIDTT